MTSQNFCEVTNRVLNSVDSLHRAPTKRAAIMKIVHFIFKTDPLRQVSRSVAHSRTLYEAPSLENNQNE